jgi:hypothetical protein
MKALFAIFFVVLLAGCSRKEEASQEDGTHEHAHAQAAFPIADSIDTSVRTNRLSREKFFQEIYLSAYERNGRKSPKWDAQARAFLSKLAASAGQRRDSDPAELDRLIKDVQAAGCEDPLVRYMILRNTQDPYHAHEKGTNQWVEAATDLDASSYHQYWKFFAFARASEALKSTSPRTNSPAVVKFRGDTSKRLIDLVKDYTLPTSVMFEAVHSWLLSDLGEAPKLRAWTYEHVEPALLQGWGDTAEAQLIRGAFYIKYAWDARGAGWASTVNDDGWKLMDQRLKISRECLERAWLIKPMEEIAVKMLTVELGDSTGRKGMERWFDNAMQLNPASYDACDAKLYWLMPKWHGSAKEVIAFGRECLSNRVGQIPLILYHGHRQLATYHKQTNKGETEADYWKQPNVWPDVKSSFETFFEVNPEAIGWRHDYAMAAYKCEAWDDLRKQIKLLGPINYPYFGGKESFAEMVRKAEQYGKESTTL